MNERDERHHHVRATLEDVGRARGLGELPRPALRADLSPQAGRGKLRRARWLFASWAITACLFVCCFASDAAHAQTSVEDFYKIRQINLIVGYGPGGCYDITARLLARHLGDYIPGHPAIVVQNMAGAGSMRAANYLYVGAPRDGTTFGVIGRDMPLIGLIGSNASVQFDAAKFTWLGSSSSFANDAYVLIVRPGAPVQSIAAAQRPGAPPLVLGGTGEGATDGDVPKILRDALGLNIKQVLGYPDSPSIFLAVERGEVDGRTFDLSSVKASKPKWLKPDSGYRVLLQFARMTRHPDLPDVPIARELALNDAARELIVFAEAPLLRMARPFAAPPGLPADRAQALQAAFLAAHRDPGFLAEAAKLGVDISPVSAQEMLAGIAQLARSSPATFEYMRKLLAAEKGG
jgi:tripartite-type tricarboxylate transporter receptor subunit TctC